MAIFFPQYASFQYWEIRFLSLQNPPLATDRRVNPTLAAYDSRKKKKKNQRWLGGIPSLLPVPVQLHRRVGFFVNLFLFLLH
jgi:hypothetical protein